MTDETKSTKMGSAYIRWALAITTIYGIGVIVGVYALRPDKGFAYEFSSLGLNELGDFLAGVFAPMAFLWLVTAVGVQSQELAAQRIELELTRREFEEGRKVSLLQAEEARRQAEFIGAQTELLKQQIQAREWELADAEQRRRIQGVRDLASQHREEQIKLYGEDALAHEPFLWLGNLSTEPEIAVADLMHRLIEHWPIDGDETKIEQRARRFNGNFLRELLMRLQSIYRMQDRVSPTRKAFVESAFLEAGLKITRDFFDLKYKSFKPES